MYVAWDTIIATVWETVTPPNFLCVCVSRFYDLNLDFYRSDFDETWWKCWNIAPIDCIKFQKKIGSVMTSLWHYSWFFSFAKGQDSAEKGNNKYVLPRLTQATAILYVEAILKKSHIYSSLSLKMTLFVGWSTNNYLYLQTVQYNID